MATMHDTTTATVLKFTGDWEGRFEPSGFQLKAQQNALRDARGIIEAKNENNDWTANLLVGLLGVLDDEQRTRLELALAGREDESQGARSAMALVRYANSSKEYRERIKSAVQVLCEQEAK